MAVARLTGLEPATPGVTGRYSNQLSYNRARCPGALALAGVTRLLFRVLVPVKRPCTPWEVYSRAIVAPLARR